MVLSKAIIVLMCMTILYLILVRTTGLTSYVQTDAAIAPEITQSILNTVLSSAKDFVPLDTVFNNRQADGTYLSRFMLYNTKHFFGKQVDIQSRINPGGSVSILNMSNSVQVDTNTGYKGDEYQPWHDIEDNLNGQFNAALASYKSNPPQPRLDTLMTRS